MFVVLIWNIPIGVTFIMCVDIITLTQRTVCDNLLSDN